MNRTTVGIGIVVLIGIFVGFALLGNKGVTVLNDNSLIAPTEDSIDITMELMRGWLDNQQATTSVSLADFLDTQNGLTDQARSMLLTRQAVGGSLDPVLCQEVIPGRIGAKQIYTQSTDSQVMVMARGADKNPNTAVVTLIADEGEWVVDDVACSAGEQGNTEGEFVFVQSGRLVQASVPAPYDTTQWHLIFTTNTESTGIVPLTFDDASICAGGVSCNPATFTEGTVAEVKADMTEAGALVRQLQ